MNENDARISVVRAGLRLVEKGLTARTWGNISCRLSDTEFIITPSGIPYDVLKPEDLVKVKIADLSYTGDKKPSSEKGIHADAYKNRPNVDFVIHTHQDAATVVSVAGKDIRIEDKDLFRILSGTVPCCRYGLPSTKKLRKNIEKRIIDTPEAKAFLMVSHGALVLGTDEDNAFELAEALEKASAAYAEKICPGIFDGNAVIKAADILCKTKRRLPDLTDDLVQCAGPHIKAVEGKKNGESDEIFKARISDAFGKRDAVLVSGKGIECRGADAEAIGILAKKSCEAFLFAEKLAEKGKKVRQLGIIDAKIQRIIYRKKYSKIAAASKK